jgi:drug/metabolite transporter (DMT)-like permease
MGKGPFLAQAGRGCVPVHACHGPPVNPLLGISLKVVSAFVFTLMSAGLKIVSTRYPVGELVFFRSAFALVPLLVWLAWQGDLINAVRTDNIRGHMLRGLIGSCGMFSGFVALAYLPLHETIALGYAAPLIVVVLAATVLKETVRAYRWTAVFVGFIGVLVMLSPHLNAEMLSSGLKTGAGIGVAFALFGACCSAGAAIQVRLLTASERTGAIVLYFSLLTAVLGLSTIVLGWRMPDASDFTLLALIGILGGIGQILMTQSYRYADTSIIAPFDYTTMIFAVLIGWFAFGDLPSLAVTLGAVVVISAGIFVVWRERHLGLVRRDREAASSQRVVGG